MTICRFCFGDGASLPPLRFQKVSAMAPARHLCGARKFRRRRQPATCAVPESFGDGASQPATSVVPESFGDAVSPPPLRYQKVSAMVPAYQIAWPHLLTSLTAKHVAPFRFSLIKMTFKKPPKLSDDVWVVQKCSKSWRRFVSFLKTMISFNFIFTSQ